MTAIIERPKVAWQKVSNHPLLQNNKIVREAIAPILVTVVLSWFFIKTRNQVMKWDWSLQATLWPILTLVTFYLYKVMGIPNFPKFYRDERQLGWIRICVGLALLSLAFKDDILTSLILPEEYAYHWYGPMASLYKRFPDVFQFRNESWLLFVQWGTRISLLMATIGLLTRFSLILSFFFFLNFYFVQILYTHFYSSGYLTLLMLGFLIFLPCRALSVDHLFFKKDVNKKGLDLSPAIFACFAAYGMSYFVCGLSKWKLESYWAASNNMKKYIGGDAAALIDRTFGLDLIPTYIQMGGPDQLFFILGTSVLIFETGALLVLFSNWGRFFLPPLLMCFHFGTLFLQKFIFPELVIVAAMFFPIALFLKKDKGPTNAKSAPKKSSLPLILFSCFLVSHIASGWLTNHKVYPWSNTWNMYAYSGYAEKTWYNYYYLNLENGEKIKTDLTETIHFLGQAKWHSLSYWPRDAQEEQKLKNLLASYSSVYNSKAKPGEKIVSIDFVHWIWDFVNDYDSPTHGDPNKALRYNISSGELKSLPITEF